MNLQQFLLILRARWLIVAAAVALSGIGALTVSLLLPKQYTATASVVVDFKSPDPITALAMPLSMATQVDIINSDRVSRRVVQQLGLANNPGIRERFQDESGGKGRIEVWLADLLQRKLAVNPSRDSNIIHISFAGADPAFAASVANAYAQAYIDTNIELKVEPAKHYARWFSEQGKSLREALERAQASYSAFQQEKGIVARDEQLDVETAKFAELTTQLVAVQAQNADALSKSRSGAAMESLPEVAQNQLLATLKADIARQEARLTEAAVNFGANHPQYRRMASEIAALREQLASETRHVAGGFSASRNVGRDKEAELRAALEAQKKRLLELKSERDQLAVLQRDVDAAQAAYDAVVKRYTQTSLESQATQTNVSVLTPATEPLDPSSPKVFRNAVIAIFLGVLLGVGGAFMLELLDRRIRSADDLVELFSAPVLGALSRESRPGRFAFWRRGRAPAAG